MAPDAPHDDACTSGSDGSSCPNVPGTLATRVLAAVSEGLEQIPAGVGQHQQHQQQQQHHHHQHYIPPIKLFQVHMEDDWLGSWIQWLIAAILCLGVVVHILILGCFAADGWFAAKLVTLGIITESWGAQSASAVCALLRMKKTATPQIELVGKVTDRCATELARAVVDNGSVAKTQSIALQHTQMTAAGVRSMCDIIFRSASGVSALDLSDNPDFGDEAACALEQAIAGTESRPASLRLLRLCNCSLTSKSLETFSTALGTSVLRTLDLSMNSFKGGGPRLRSLLDSAAMLQELRLIDCQLDDEDVAELSPGLVASEVVRLDLAYNNVTVYGLEALGEHIPESSLETLSLANNKIEGDQRQLAKLAGSWASGPRTKESRLDLRGNPLSSEDLQAFDDILSTLLP